MTRAVVYAYHNVGVRCLKVLLAHGVDVALVVTHPDDPRESIWFDSVAATAADYGLPAITPDNPNTPDALRRARELAPEVRVNAIAPGPVMWPVGGADEALQTEIIGRTALKRLGSPRDVALAARYFAVDAPFVTGQILAVDGGRSVA